MRESLEHLAPWMPWADATSGDVEFQRQRLRGRRRPMGARRGVPVRTVRPRRDARPRIVRTDDASRPRHASRSDTGCTSTRSAAATRPVPRPRSRASPSTPGVKHVLIYTDVANLRSAAIPRKLGFELLRIEDAAAFGIQRDRPPAGLAALDADSTERRLGSCRKSAAGSAARNCTIAAMRNPIAMSSTENEKTRSSVIVNSGNRSPTIGLGARP